MKREIWRVSTCMLMVESLAWLLIGATVFLGCNNQITEDVIPKEFTVQNRDAMSQIVYADEIAGESLQFYTTDGWTSTYAGSTGTANWLTFDPKSGNTAGQYTVTFHLEQNITGSERTATIILTCNGSDVTVTITQKATTKDGKLYEEPFDVYVAGNAVNDKGEHIAMLWKNGLPQILTDGTSAYSVYVSNGDVYVAGNKTWKNGKVLYENGGRSIFVTEDDVYVAGSVQNNRSIAVVWKNGVPQYLTNDSYNAYAQSVFVSGDDVYVAGYIAGSFAILWKNGVAQYLTNGNDWAYAESVYVSGDDVYVAGAEGYFWPVAKLWKNGVEQNLKFIGTNLRGEPTNMSEANSVFVSNNDVFTSGTEFWDISFFPTLWINDERQSLSGHQTFSVFVLGNDVFVAGIYAGFTTTRARLWKNGVVQDLTDGKNDAEARSVFVVNK